jgi:hypothetical protein
MLRAAGPTRGAAPALVLHTGSRRRSKRDTESPALALHRVPWSPGRVGVEHPRAGPLRSTLELRQGEPRLGNVRQINVRQDESRLHDAECSECCIVRECSAASSVAYICLCGLHHLGKGKKQAKKVAVRRLAARASYPAFAYCDVALEPGRRSRKWRQRSLSDGLRATLSGAPGALSWDNRETGQRAKRQKAGDHCSRALSRLDEMAWPSHHGKRLGVAGLAP